MTSNTQEQLSLTIEQKSMKDWPHDGRIMCRDGLDVRKRAEHGSRAKFPTDPSGELDGMHLSLIAGLDCTKLPEAVSMGEQRSRFHEQSQTHMVLVTKFWQRL